MKLVVQGGYEFFQTTTSTPLPGRPPGQPGSGACKPAAV